MSSEKTYLKEIIAGTVATVLGGIILALFPATRSFFANLFKIIGNFLSNLWKFLFSEISLSWMIIFVLVILALPTILKFIRALTPKTETDKQPKVDDYKEDIFFGIIWRWSSGDIVAYCPTCQTRLVYHMELSFPENRTTLFCETCNKGLNQFDGDKHSILGKVWRQRERKINTGEWKRTVEGKEETKN